MTVDRPGADSVASPEAADPPSRSRRLAPVVALMLIAPWAAECSWGGFPADEFLTVVLILAPMYGGAAVLIRETARRAGGGWPAIVLLAAAFGMLQAGLVDQSLFNPDYLDDTGFAAEAVVAKATWVPALGFSAGQAFDFIGNHVTLSMCAPIALVESFVAPPRRHRPWLGRPGLAVVGVLYLLGSLLIFSDESGRKDFMASPSQVAFATSVVLALVGIALLPRWRRRGLSPASRPAPRPVWVGAVVIGANLGSWFVSGWPGVGVRVALVAAIAAVVVAWSRRADWGQRHVLAAWAAPMILAAVGAYLVPNYEPTSAPAALISDVAVSVITLTLVGAAYRHAARTRPAYTRPA
ncbi:hypothetical protein [Pseudofrankia sp. BMG5.36]|uniref:hypothetical protein n=1 Tax=Pseudofrankia sp. BMG5.36 TaxID=1834512 RepID=UPI0018E2A94D|nr:hypothetical protein [Pseudofrankia sp. BMG5.36]